IRGNVARRRVPAEWLWTVRHDRERLGVDYRLVSPQASGRHGQDVLHSAEPSRTARRGQLRSLTTPDQNSTQGAERRIASVRAELLSPLSARGALSGAG